MSGLPTLGPRGEGWVVLQLVLLGGVAGAGMVLGPDVTAAPRFAAALAGAALMVGGVALVLRGVRDLGQSLSVMPRPPPGATLMQQGVYRRIRHPIYAGVVLSSAGWGLITASLVSLLLVLVLALLLDLKARREEHWLVERFPAYAEYARRTRRFLPGLY